MAVLQLCLLCIFVDSTTGHASKGGVYTLQLENCFNQNPQIHNTAAKNRCDHDEHLLNNKLKYM